MKIAHIITALRGEGAQVMLYKLLSRMEKSRFDSTVVTLSDRGPLAEKFESLDVPVYAINLRAELPTLTAVLRLLRKIREIKPDLIQGWMYHGNLAAQLTGSLLPYRVPVLWNIRGAHYTLKNEKPATAATIWLGAKLSGLPAKIINNSEESALGHEERLGYRADKRVVIPNGFDTDIYSPSPSARASVRKEMNLPAGAVLIGLIARYHPAKDHATFLGAAARLLKSHNQVRFVLVGDGVDASNAQLCETLNQFGIWPNVHLLGHRKDIARLSAAMDIVSLSSYCEGFPNAVGEAMACGVPCVATDVGDSALLVGDTGLIVPPRDPSALADAWKTLIDMGSERRQMLGTLARQRVVEKFSLDTIASQYATLYTEMLSQTNR
ncbi:MAG TPA: glycosyltransferase [Blastocatellia bacterium]|jgi:glycosyltransferase involved in cell wall biosynthesis|nr:glycosyltransferase [Blastocatellia bacterium]